MNLVSEDFVKKHNLLYLVKNATFKLVGITGMPLQVVGVIRGAHVIIKGTVFEIDLVVTSKMKEECILGQIFFEKYGMILDFNNKTVSNYSFIANLCERPPNSQEPPSPIKEPPSIIKEASSPVKEPPVKEAPSPVKETPSVVKELFSPVKESPFPVGKSPPPGVQRDSSLETKPQYSVKDLILMFDIKSQKGHDTADTHTKKQNNFKKEPLPQHAVENNPLREKSLSKSPLVNHTAFESLPTQTYFICVANKVKTNKDKMDTESEESTKQDSTPIMNPDTPIDPPRYRPSGNQ